MINVSRDSPRYHLLLVARFTRIDHDSEFYTGVIRLSDHSLNPNDRSINLKEDLFYIVRSLFSLFLFNSEAHFDFRALISFRFHRDIY